MGVAKPGAGWMQDELTELASSRAAFATDLGPATSGVTVVTLAEFGRRVAENASRGTDHGHGNLIMLLGGGVVGSGVLADGDLPGSTDYRLVPGELLERRTSPAASSVFPGLTGAYLGVARSR